MSNSSIQIRDGLPNDAQAIAHFARNTFSDAFGADMTMADLQTHLDAQLSDDALAQMLVQDMFLLAFDNTKLVGFVQSGRVALQYGEFLNTFDAHGSEVRRLYVSGQQQNRGLGTRLLQHALSRLDTGAAVYLTTWQDNIGAQRLYTRHGFTKVGAMPEYAVTGELNGYEYIYRRSPGH